MQKSPDRWIGHDSPIYFGRQIRYHVIRFFTDTLKTECTVLKQELQGKQQAFMVDISGGCWE